MRKANSELEQCKNKLAMIFSPMFRWTVGAQAQRVQNLCGIVGMAFLVNQKKTQIFSLPQELEILSNNNNNNNIPVRPISGTFQFPAVLENFSFSTYYTSQPVLFVLFVLHKALKCHQIDFVQNIDKNSLLLSNFVCIPIFLPILLFPKICF